jgi:hypothetical protein
MPGRARSRRTYRVRTRDEFPDLGFEEAYGDLDVGDADTETAYGDPEEAGRDADVAHAEPARGDRDADFAYGEPARTDWDADAAYGDAAEFVRSRRQAHGPRPILSRRGAGVVGVAVVAMAIGAVVVHAVRSQLSSGAGGLPAAATTTTTSQPPAGALVAPATRGGLPRAAAVAAAASESGSGALRSAIAHGSRAGNTRAGGSASTKVVVKGTATNAATETETKTLSPSEVTPMAPTATLATSASGDHGPAAGTSSAIPEFGFER